MLETLAQDVRFAIRGWGRSPGYAIAAVVTLALGIGANTAVFSVVSGVLLRPLPFRDPSRLVQITEIQPGSANNVRTAGPVFLNDFLDFRSRGNIVEGISTYTVSGRRMAGWGQSERVSVLTADRTLFTILGGNPAAGRGFSSDDPLTVAVVSSRFCHSHFGAFASALGRTIELEGQAYSIIGVMPEGFQFPYRNDRVDAWLPFDPFSGARGPNARLDGVVARLRPGISIDAARRELGALEAPVRAGRQVVLTSLADVIGEPVRRSLLILLGAVGMVLLVACVNVANLLLARTAARDREIAVRTALGASRPRLIRQFLTESLLLAFAGGVAGLVLGIGGRSALVRAAAEQLPRADEIGLDWRVFAFLVVGCSLAGIAFGLAPALTATRSGASALRSRGATAMVRDGLVVVEVALAFVLLIGAGLLLRTFLNLQRTDSGLRTDNILTVHMVLSGGPEATAIADRVAGVHGVRAAGFISMLPLQHTGWTAGFRIPGRPGIRNTELRYVTPGYFRAMGIPIKAGREFTPADRDPKVESIVIVINEALAKENFPDQNPVGLRIDRGLIIGVAGDVRQAKLSEPATPVVFYSMAQNFAQIRNNGSTLVVNGSVPVEGLGASIRAAVHEVSPDQPLFRIETMKRVVENSLASQRLYTWLLSLFAGIGALMAVAGIYGVVAYLVALRTREFGIRMALGADASRVLAMVMRRGAIIVSVGLLLGMAGAAILTGVLSSILYGVSATDPATFASVAALMALVALAACLLPAIRASRVDPATALRVD